ncbi:hypothetical protein [Actinomadura luteofluorescens]|uniref:hypothetical protein n=1 Tax=Actinomadura luteofluorescens TaxID=46163 RepID=UPI003D92A09C
MKRRLARLLRAVVDRLDGGRTLTVRTGGPVMHLDELEKVVRERIRRGEPGRG